MRGKTLQIAIKNASGSYETIAQATSHKFSVSNQTADVTTKDLGKSKEITGRSWSMTTDNLVCSPHSSRVSGVHARELLSKMTVGAELDIRLQYAIATLPQTDENEGNETSPAPVVILTGKARITKMDLNFQNKENASYTAEFQGIGKPTIPA